MKMMPQSLDHAVTLEQALARIDELERMMSRLRHDVCGALAPALLMADGLRSHADPQVRRAGEMMGRAIDRITGMLKRTYEAVPAQSPDANGPNGASGGT
jgi:hypothetical protein